MTTTPVELEAIAILVFKLLERVFPTIGNQNTIFGFLMLKEPSMPVQTILDTDLTADHEARRCLASLNEIN
jgi:hypothetical protein